MCIDVNYFYLFHNFFIIARKVLLTILYKEHKTLACSAWYTQLEMQDWMPELVAETCRELFSGWSEARKFC